MNPTTFCKCCSCGEWFPREELHGHHIHFRAIWPEIKNLGPLIPICKPCHKVVHAEAEEAKIEILRKHENWKKILERQKRVLRHADKSVFDWAPIAFKGDPNEQKVPTLELPGFEDLSNTR